MARQAVRQAGYLVLGLFQVAIQTPTHIRLHRRMDERHVTDVTMTGLAVDAGPDVGLMGEVDEIGLLVYAVPLNWLTALPVTGQGLHFLAFGGYDGVAAHASLHRGYAGHV